MGHRATEWAETGGYGVAAASSLTAHPPMTVAHLLDILSKLDPEMRVLVPGQEWGWADLARAARRTVAFAPIGDRADMGAWITQPLDVPEAPRERCVLLTPRPSHKRKPRP